MTVRPTSVKRSRARLTEEIVAKTFWDDLAAIGKTIPKSELASLPRDAAQRFDEYFDDVHP